MSNAELTGVSYNSGEQNILLHLTPVYVKHLMHITLFMLTKQNMLVMPF